MKYLSDWEVPTSIYSVLERNDATRGNYPVSLYVSADMRSCWFSINTGDLPYDDRKLRVYGELPVRQPEFYTQILEETLELTDTVLGQLINTLMLEKSDEEQRLVLILNKYRDTHTESAIHLDVHDLDLPSTTIEANAGHSSFEFPHHPEFPYDPEFVVECLRWWAEADPELVTSFLENYLRDKSSLDFIYVPYNFLATVTSFIEIAKLQIASTSS